LDEKELETEGGEGQ